MLHLSKGVLPVGTGQVADDKGKLNCGKLCHDATASYPAGTVVTLTATPDLGSTFDGWSGDCSGTSQTCTLTMNANMKVTAKFSLLGLLSADDDAFAVPGAGGRSAIAPSFGWLIQLDVPEAVGQVALNGQAIRVARGASPAQLTARGGDNLVEGQLVEGTGEPGTWRFEAQEGEAIQPGSLRVMRGDVVVVTQSAVVFRLKGQPGEQVAFSYRVR
jgi:uncharacterized repeat protein (TIGR02543 family)